MTKKITPAQRVETIQEYYFSRKLKEVASLNAAGADIVSLGIGGPDRMPHPDVVQALIDDAQQSDAHSYQPFTGLPELRRAYADWYKQTYGVTLNPDTEIQPLIGSKEAIIHLSLTFLNPGDGVLVPNPGYITYTSASRLVGATVYNYNLREDNGWQPDFDELEKMPLDTIKMMWINYPHMPTGAPADMDVMRKIVDFGRRHGIVIAHDNPYSFILNDHPRSILEIEGARDICVEMNSLSKSHNMAGWRMAMIATNPTFMQWFIKVKSNVDSGQFRPAMKAAIRALHLDNQWYTTLNAEYRERRRIAEDIARTLGCTFDPNQRGLFLWCRMPDSYTGTCEEFADRILYDAHVFVTPGSIFGSNGDRYIRISLCANQPNLNKALERVSHL